MLYYLGRAFSKLGLRGAVIMKKKAFTLIELLIVVAIIAILAAIAVPNFLEAQTRAKVSKTMADIRTMSTALETYAIDHTKYPFDKTQEDGFTPKPLNALSWYVSNHITSPVAYLTGNQLTDPFREHRTELIPYHRRYRYIAYGLGDFNLSQGNINTAQNDIYRHGLNVYGPYRVNSSGPDGEAGARSAGVTYYPPPYANFLGDLLPYDATNGTVSGGDIIRSPKVNLP